MRVLLDKSEESLEAANLLKDEELFASSVHCYYYSCIQLMRFILFYIYEIDEEDFDNRLTDNSHNTLINEITNKIDYSVVNLNRFKADFRRIKYLRKDADYKQKLILKIDCNEAQKLARNISNTLKEVNKDKYDFR